MKIGEKHTVIWCLILKKILHELIPKACVKPSYHCEDGTAKSYQISQTEQHNKHYRYGHFFTNKEHPTTMMGDTIWMGCDKFQKNILFCSESMFVG